MILIFVPLWWLMVSDAFSWPQFDGEDDHVNS